MKHDFIFAPHDDNKFTVFYSRVSSHDQKNDLITQQSKLLHFAKINNFNNIKLISDLGSGLNFKKSGLNLLFTSYLLRTSVPSYFLLTSYFCSFRLFRFSVKGTHNRLLKISICAVGCLES